VRPRGSEAPGAGDQESEAARGRVERHALLGAGARALAGARGAPRPRCGRARRARRARGLGPRRRLPHPEAHAQSRRLPVDARHRARRGSDRRFARQGSRRAAGGLHDQGRARGAHQRARGLRPVLRPRDPRPRPGGEDAGLDGPPHRARGPARHQPARGHHQLRDARARPADARLRQREARGRHRRALHEAGRAREAAERAGGRASSGPPRDRRRDRSRRPGRRDGRLRHDGGSGDHRSVLRGGVLPPQGGAGQGARAGVDERRGLSLRARRGPRGRGCGDRARDRADARDLRRPGGPALPR
jgi:hypothetical protein